MSIACFALYTVKEIIYEEFKRNMGDFIEMDRDLKICSKIYITFVSVASQFWPLNVFEYVNIWDQK